MKANDKKDVAISAIRDVHSDTRESLDVTLDMLEEIRDAADELIDAVKADISNQ